MPSPFQLPRTTEKTDRLPSVQEQAAARYKALTTGGEDYQPSSGDVDWTDIAKGGVTGLRDMVEGTAGMVGDAERLKWALTRYLAQKAGLLPVADTLEKYTRLPIPNTEDVGAATDWMVSKLPQGATGPINDWTRHDATTPFGGAARFGAGMIDPFQGVM